MRIAVTGDVQAPGFAYRALDPLKEMARRGHTVVWPADSAGHLDGDALSTCDVLHFYRIFDDANQKLIRRLRAQGLAFTWDNDDDYSVYTPESPTDAAWGPAKMARMFRDSVMTAKLAQVATFPSTTLAETFRSEGVAHATVIENAAQAVLPSRRPKHPDRRIVIGWIAGTEHVVDLERLGLTPVLRRLQQAHPNLHVEAIGVDLGLSERYTHNRFVPFEQLGQRIAGFDIGIAPLADIPFNHARSNIKIKEYAALGVPWLASPLPPYLPHGEEHGGRLVADDAWFDVLDDLIRSPTDLRRLRGRGLAWSKSQRIATIGDQWEVAFEQAIKRRRDEARV